MCLPVAVWEILVESWEIGLVVSCDIFYVYGNTLGRELVASIAFGFMHLMCIFLAINCC